MPILQSSVRQARPSSRRTGWRSASRNSRRKKTVLPPSGHHPGRGLQLEPGLEPLEVLQHVGRPPPAAGVRPPPTPGAAQRPWRQRETRPDRWLRSSAGRRTGRSRRRSVRNRWSTMRKRSGWKTSSASAIPTHSYGIPGRAASGPPGSGRSACCAPRCPPGTGTPAPAPEPAGRPHARSARSPCRRRGRRSAPPSTADGRDWPARRSVGPATASSSRIGTRIAPGSSGEPGVPYRCGSLCSGRHHL